MPTKTPTKTTTSDEIQGHAVRGGSLADDELQGLLAKASDEQLTNFARSLRELYLEEKRKGRGILSDKE